MATNAPTRQSMSKMAQQSGNTGNINFLPLTPQQIKSVLLQDGWHEITGTPEYTTFAVAPGNSPASPNYWYSAISFRDSKSNKEVIVPLSKVIAYEPNFSNS